MRNSDERLLAEYVAGDEDALSRLIDSTAWGPRLRGSSSWLARQRADDVTQDVFVTARAARRFAGRSTLGRGCLASR